VQVGCGPIKLLKMSWQRKVVLLPKMLLDDGYQDCYMLLGIPERLCLGPPCVKGKIK